MAVAVVVFVAIGTMRVLRVPVIILGAVAVGLLAWLMLLVIWELARMVTFAGPEECQGDSGSEDGSPAKNGSHRRESSGARQGGARGNRAAFDPAAHRARKRILTPWQEGQCQSASDSS